MSVYARTVEIIMKGRGGFEDINNPVGGTGH